MSDRLYYRPVPCEFGRWPIAGGWTRFSQCELLQRGQLPQLTDDIPDDVLEGLTAPRADVLGLSLDRPRLMGIVNVTPDSFSDGGLLGDAATAITHGQGLIAAGAEILDIGGESTRPGALAVSVSQEIDRLAPVIKGLQASTPISVDTRKSAVAQAGLQAGAGMINDVSAMQFDPAMAATVAGSGAAICLMHAQGLPENMQVDPRYDDVVLDVYDALQARITEAVSAGISPDHIVVDPGIGFGKTGQHNLAILRRISLYHGLGVPVLLGLSRKRFIGTYGRAENPRDRGPGTLALTLAAVSQGIQIHRVHDTAEIDQGVRLWRAVYMRDGNEQRDFRD